MNSELGSVVECINPVDKPNRGGVSFPNFLPDPSAVCVLDGLGPVGGGMHTRNEYLNLCSLERRIHLIAEALIYVRDHR